jgi:hypothetical protein
MAETLFAPDADSFRLFGSRVALPTTPGGVMPGVLATRRDEIARWYQERLEGFDFTYHAHSQILEWTEDEPVLGAVSGHAEHATDGGCLYAAIRNDNVYRLVDRSWASTSGASR